MLSDKTASATQQSQDNSQQKTVVFMVTLNAFTTPVMLSATNVALPAVSEQFALSAVMVSWVPMAYLMASAMFILIFGRLSDAFGRKRIFLIGTMAVIVSSIFTGLSSSSAMLLTGRFLQGVSAAMLYATQMAIVFSVYPSAQRGKAIGIVVSAVYAGLAAGPLLGGVATDWFGWRANFFLHIPLALIVLYLGLKRVQGDWSGNKIPFDFTGALFYCGAIALLCVGISNIPEKSSIILLLLFVASTLLFVGHIKRHANPIFDIRLFLNNAIFTRSCGASLIMYTATYSNVVLLSLYLQQLKLLSASQAGMILMIQPIAMALLSPAAGKLSDRMESRTLASAGMLLTLLGLGLLSTLDASSQLFYVILALALTGIGFGLFSSPNTNAIMSSVPKHYYGAASGAVATTRILGQLGSIVLVAFAMSIFIGDQQINSDTLDLLEQSIQLSFGVAAVLCIPGIILSLLRGRMHESGSRKE